MSCCCDQPFTVHQTFIRPWILPTCSLQLWQQTLTDTKLFLYLVRQCLPSLQLMTPPDNGFLWGYWFWHHMLLGGPSICQTQNESIQHPAPITFWPLAPCLWESLWGECCLLERHLTTSVATNLGCWMLTSFKVLTNYYLSQSCYAWDLFSYTEKSSYISVPTAFKGTLATILLEWNLWRKWQPSTNIFMKIFLLRIL